MANNRNAGVFFILVTILFDCIGFGIIIPIMPALIKELTGATLSEASEYGGFLLTVYSLMMFACSPILGALSDKTGRRTVLLISLFGMAIDYFFLAFAHTISLLFLGRIIAGICGASITTASAYIADVSTPEKRAQNFGLIGAAFGLGFIIGPVIGGVFSQFGTRVPFMIAGGLSLINWLYGYFILPESLKKENRRKFEWKRANPVGALMQIKRYPSLLGLLAALLILFIAAQSTQTVWAFYTQEKFHWNETWIGYSLGFVGLTVAIVQGGLIRIIIPKFGQKKSIMFGLSLYVLGFVLFAFASKGWMMFAFMVPYALAGITGPAIQGIISTQVKPDEQGELQGIMTSFMSLASIIGPLLMSYLFAHFTSKQSSIYFPGAPFMMGAVLTCVSIVICYQNLKKHH
ncbi:TCR/Tet family MFS transporter [Pedobacter chitinilyticus]|uniref:MFS transporter n=1 Tax=Pedobacter chitinilyticus TaxID=2233776 RepID=A0A3S3SU33_9SPHI|nr:TCR/Tet family MFS transporter [Pedobacter chitinilyticus]RWU10388.1 MFS transporter [Pedobacter chitinilyticus]